MGLHLPVVSPSVVETVSVVIVDSVTEMVNETNTCLYQMKCNKTSHKYIDQSLFKICWFISKQINES